MWWVYIRVKYAENSWQIALGLGIHQCYMGRIDCTVNSLVSIGSGNGLLPLGNKPLPEPMLTKIYITVLLLLQATWQQLQYWLSMCCAGGLWRVADWCMAGNSWTDGPGIGDRISIALVYYSMIHMLFDSSGTQENYLHLKYKIIKQFAWL